MGIKRYVYALLLYGYICEGLCNVLNDTTAAELHQKIDDLSAQLKSFEGKLPQVLLIFHLTNDNFSSTFSGCRRIYAKIA